ncbi:MAG: ribosomal protein S18-alanine N-acetyltransferase [Arthrospira platensis PCC 7345]|nr:MULTISPECIES: ribosomal protein S18-alanine N-acetyltransferase [Arthrospira]MDF2210679.1 ribosomal protein S18-alanine N-acetyltransferase [Arthrospira platensis NCB002]MDT9182160.1 ribosomal protein S18-alanine N-acetyltransferase [Limnospira sp. PMC 289.06]MDT9294306.1 ribosomal protein S18-alanine N-acetyltransferase [Arthrospira platensis PCC 7345]MDT9309926.1 ribosomal protein S18-alanine N-acetyltransferase [Limnospira sp. Paracas R14]
MLILIYLLAFTPASVTILQLKLLTPDLLPAVVELDRLCLGGLWNQSGYQRELNSANSDLVIWTHPTYGQPLSGLQTISVEVPQTPPPPVIGIGCLWAIVDEAHITLLAIHPDYRRLGLGSNLLRALLQLAQQRGLSHATLEVKASNDIALSLYQKFGFQIAGRRNKYYADTGEDALILWLSGLPSLI